MKTPFDTALTLRGCQDKWQSGESVGNPIIGGHSCFWKNGVCIKCSEPSNWISAAPLKFDPKSSEMSFSAVLSNYEKWKPDVVDDVISSRFVRAIVPDKYVKFRDPCFKSSEEIQPKAVGCGIFGRFWNYDNC